MTRARIGALIVLAAALIAAAAIALTRGREPPHPLQRPTLLLLTSLPLMFGEQFSLSGGGSPALTALHGHYRVVPISVVAAPELRKGSLLLMAHPLAQPAEDLVALDRWVRLGGRVLLLADPMLEWPSSRPLGDRLRPPPMFMDTGLLAHWGLRLDAPEQRGFQVRRLDGHEVLTVSPGTLSGRCRIGQDGLVARCRIGRGRATIVADADFLDTDRLGSRGAGNLDALLGELAELQRK